MAYFVNGVRRGFEKYEPYLPNTAFRPAIRGVPFGSQFPRAIREMLVKNGILNSDYTPNEETATRLGWKLSRKDEAPIMERWWLSAEEREALRDKLRPRGRPIPEHEPAPPTHEAAGRPSRD